MNVQNKKIFYNHNTISDVKLSKEGFIRKIDDLGRVVIPKEIRKKLKLQDNENILINYCENYASISKYSYISTNKEYLNKLGELVNEIFKIDIVITDRDNVIYSNIDYKKYKINGNNALYSETTYYLYKSEILNDSTKIGDLIIFAKEKNLVFEKLCKLISKIIEISFIIS